MKRFENRKKITARLRALLHRASLYMRHDGNCGRAILRQARAPTEPACSCGHDELRDEIREET